MQELIDEIVKKLIKEVKGQTRIELVVALKELLYVVSDLQRRDRVMN